MQRRDFTKVLGAGAAFLPAAAAGAPGREGIKVGVITHAGGAHLDAYFAALAEADEVAAVSLSDPGGQNVDDAREALGTKLGAVYDEPATLIREQRPVMALVSMEAALAPPAIEVALRAGCHVMAEKPACVRIEDFRGLHELAKTNDLHLMLALANRLNPEVREARRLIGEGMMGEIYGVEAHLIADQTRLTRPAYHETWYAKRARGGGGHLIWLGIHWLDLVQYITGDRVQKVGGFTSNVGGQPVDIEDAAVLSLLYKSGMVGTMHSGYYLDRGYHSHLAVWGEKGWLRFDLTAQQPLEWQSTLEGMPEGIQTFSYHRGTNFYLGIIQAAVDCARGPGDSGKSAEESLSVLKTIFGLYQAAETGRTQTVG